eukprot:4698810-Heterocapsa_arctica.AAC.1
MAEAKAVAAAEAEAKAVADAETAEGDAADGDAAAEPADGLEPPADGDTAAETLRPRAKRQSGKRKAKAADDQEVGGEEAK